MKLHRNILIWHSTTFFGSAAFILPIWVLFNTQVLGLSNAQAFLLGTIPYGVSALFEVPSGTWADKYGRVRMYQLGTVLYIISAASFIFISNFIILLILQFVGALGIAMQSGCREALAHDSISGSDKNAVYSKEHGRNLAILFISRIITVSLGGVAYVVDPRAPFILGVAMFITGLIISFSFEEVRLETPTELSSLNHLKETLKLMWDVKAIVLIMALIIFYRFIAEGLFALYQPYFQSINMNISSFGVFYAIISVFSAIGSLSTDWLIHKTSHFKMLFIMMCCLTITLLGMSLQVPTLTYVVIIPSALAFGCALNIMNTSIQKAISSRHQATALSVASFINTGFYFFAVVVVGVCLDYISVHQTVIIFTVLSFLLTIPALVSLRVRLYSTRAG